MLTKLFHSRRILPILALLVVAALTVSVAAWARPVPRIVIEPPLQELGEKPQEHLELSYTVRNAGNAPLQIEDVSTTCGCTKAAVEQANIPPGGATTLRVTMDPQQDNLYGNLFRVIFIRSNDPATPKAEAQFHVAIAKPQ